MKPCKIIRAIFLLSLPALSCLAFPAASHAQSSFDDMPRFADISREEIAMTKCPFDTDANAVVLLDAARSTPNDQYNLVTERRLRIKILNEKGFDKANVAISYYRKDDFEFISDIQGVVTNYDASGRATQAVLERRSVYDTKVNEWRSEMRFTMPDIKVGSIIEYSYTSTMKHYGGLEDWYFQTDIPTVKSFYQLYIVPNAEFAYQVYKLPTLPIKLENSKTDGRVVFEMNNIAGLREEAFMDSRRDNLQRVTFQLSGFNRATGRSKYLNSWDDVAHELLGDPDFGGQLNKSLAGTDLFIKTTKLLPDVADRLRMVYKYVQEHMGWNGYHSKYSVDGIKKAWEKGTGTNGDINLAFINLLKEVGVEVYPLLVANRYFGKVNTRYPFMDQFNTAIAYVVLPGQSLYIDAADKNTALHMVPYSYLNTYGYIVDRKKKKLLLLEDRKLYHANLVNIMATLSADGKLEGNVVTHSSGYARQERKGYLKKSGNAKFIEQFFTAPYTNVKADSLEVLNLDNDTLALEQRVVFSQTPTTAGDYTLLSYHLFYNMEKNPFTSDTRFSDINFGSPQRFLITQTIELPEGYEVDALPKNTSMITADTSIAFTRRIALQEGKLMTQMKLEINQSFFPQDDYEMIQAIYKKMYALLDEQIVLKKKK